MTTRLTVKRFRTRRPETVAAAPVAAPSAAPAAGPLSAPAAAAPQRPAPQAQAAASPRPRPAPQPVVGDDAFLPSSTDDGFGDMTFPTARSAAAPGPRPATTLPPLGDAAPGTPEAAPVEIDAIRREGLTGRQLRTARRLAQKHGLPATSDFDAVRLLRANGIDPFHANTVLELVAEGGGNPPPMPPSRALTVTPDGGNRLPQTMRAPQLPSPELQADQAHIAEVMKIQRDITRRRRRKSALLAARLFVFVLLPTLMAAIYYYTLATPLYSARTEFVIQQAEPAATAGMSSLLRGTQFATSQDSIAVQGYLQSQSAMQRLEADNGFRSHFADPGIDAILRLAPDATETDTYKLYKKMVKVAYDPSEGIIKMEILAADPDKAVEFSQALLGYAEEQVDRLTMRLREDQMKGAREAYEDAEKKLDDANRRVVELQQQFKVLSSEAEVGLITSQISGLESQLTQDRLSLAQMESNPNPNQARMEPLKRRIATIEEQIAEMRAKLTEDSADGISIAKVQSELLVAQADVATRQALAVAALQAMETAKLEASRQTRYLSVAVSPVRPDAAAYPKAFEDTLVVLLIFTGIYLLISMTIAILREQIVS